MTTQARRKTPSRIAHPPRTPETCDAVKLLLSESLAGTPEPMDILRDSAAIVGRFLGVSRVAYGEIEPGSDTIVIPADWTDGVATMVGRHPLHRQSGFVREYLRGRTMAIADVATLDLVPAEAEMMAATACASCISVPLIRDGELVALFSVTHRVPRHWRDDEIDLVEHVAARTWSTLEHSRVIGRLRDSEAALRERERHQAFLLDWSDGVRALASAEAIIAFTIERVGAFLGTARANYAEVDSDGQIFSILQEWRRDTGLITARDAISAGVHDAYLAGDVVVCEDVTRDPRFDAAARDQYVAVDATAFLAAPMFREGGLRGVLSVQVGEPRVWHPAEIQLLRDIADRIGMMTERARVAAALAARERDQALLLAWSDRIRQETSAWGMVATTLDHLGTSLDASRVTYAEVSASGTRLHILREWRSDGVDPGEQEIALASAGKRVLTDHLKGVTVAIDDVATDPRLDDAARAFYRSIDVAAFVLVPMIRGGEIIAILSVQQDVPRVWAAGEIQLLGEFGDRVWAILERRRSEERLAESEAVLAAFMDNAPIAMYLKDDGGRYVRVNRQMAAVLGCEIGDALGRTTHDFMPPAVAAEVTRLDRLALEGGVHATEIEVVDREPHTWGLSLRFAVPTDEGRPTRIGGFVIDMTERRMAEAELERSRTALYQTEKLSALGSLLAGVSHELNNPLSIVLAQAVMLERLTAGTALGERAQKISKAADRCARIVQTFLAMARQKRPERRSVDLNDIASAALDLTRYGIEADGIIVSPVLADKLPHISADADQIHQIIVNLLVNAQQAMGESPDGDRALTIRTARGPEAKTVILEVADTGPGVPEDARRRVFEPFFTTKPQGSGTGLGLSFSQGLAEAHGGRLALVPSRRGAVFRLTLPIESDRTLSPIAPENPVAPVENKKRALVVDDEADLAEALADFLSLEGFDCDVAVGGAAAKGFLTDQDYDLIVSDIRMPDVDGPALHAWIAVDRPELSDKLAFATGDTLGASAMTFLAAADRPVLEKPFTPEAVRKLLDEMEG